MPTDQPGPVTTAAMGPAAPPPLLDTPEARDALDCPLCRYSLRGLARVGEPQCPECGYRFGWAELLAARQFAHPYLFEHHPRRNVRSLVRTVVGGMRPARFWSSLNAGHEVRPRRLFRYWLIVAAVSLVVGYGGAFVAHGFTQYYQDLMWYGWGPQNPLNGTYLGMIASRTFDEDTFDLYLLAAAVAWPWLTMAALLVYQASMRAAKIRAAHVLRCVVYAGDVFLWTGAALAALGVLRWFGILSRSRMWDSGLAVRQTAVCFMLLLAVAGYRLAIAYERYLRFDHPWATAFASQVLVFLFVTTALSLIYAEFWKLMPGV